MTAVLISSPNTFAIAASSGVAGGFTRGVEGPAVDIDGNVYAPNFLKAGTIGILQPNQPPRLWLQLPRGANSASIRFDSLGRMFVADYKLHRLYLIDRKTKSLQIYFQDPTLNQPNDFTISRNGAIYLSDPTWDRHKKGHILKINPDKTVVRLDSNLRTPNGIDLSPDETRLYFTDSSEGTVNVYDIRGDELLNRRVIARFAPETVDGLRTDIQGNLFVARIGMGEIDQLSAEGVLLNRIAVSGEEPSNLAFGGPDGRTMYVSVVDTGSLEWFRVEQPGREWALQTER